MSYQRSKSYHFLLHWHPSRDVVLRQQFKVKTIILLQNIFYSGRKQYSIEHAGRMSPKKSHRLIFPPLCLISGNSTTSSPLPPRSYSYVCTNPETSGNRTGYTVGCITLNNLCARNFAVTRDSFTLFCHPPSVCIGLCNKVVSFSSPTRSRLILHFSTMARTGYHLTENGANFLFLPAFYAYQVSVLSGLNLNSL